jgi:transposase InsO family protein
VTETSMCTEAFIHSWVYRYGVPAVVTTDRGTQFTLALWQQICQRLEIDHNTTTAFHPQCNDMVERGHRQLKDAMCQGCWGSMARTLAMDLVGSACYP